MATLTSGVLLDLIRNIKPSFFSSSGENEDSSSILQVTGIVPSLADSDLFPDQGFHLQISDSSHSTYVSLPPGHDDLILSDNLQLGQLIVVRHLEASYPVPILHGLHLIPGRHPFPKHTTLVTAERKKRHSNSCPASPARNDYESDDESDRSSVVTSVSNSSSHSFVSMIPRPKTARKSWESNGRMKDGKGEEKTIRKWRSSNFTQGDFASYSSCIPKGDSSEESWAGKTDVLKRKNSTPSKMSTKNSSAIAPLSAYDDMKWPDSNVSWGSLTFNLVKYGKEVLRKRDSALYVALDSLQEACALERLLGCLSTYSELQANKDGNPQKLVDKFLEFYEDLSRAISATQSLPRTNSSFSQPSPTSALRASKEASERRKCAASWIKAALKSELSTTPTIANSMAADSTQSSSSETYSQLKKSCEYADLAKSLHSECNRWFLRYIEKFLDVIHDNTSCCKAKNESHVASLLCQLKRLDDWLVTISSKHKSSASERSKDSFLLADDGNAEACGRMRRKIYEILLRHVECAAMALESMSITDEHKVGTNLTLPREKILKNL